jgi:uncharacterized protein (TIGR03435 family)
VADFCKVVEGQLGRPVTDATRLDGKYDFNVSWNANNLGTEASGDDSATMYSAIRSLGLKLESHKEPVEVVVVDRVERSPSDN